MSEDCQLKNSARVSVCLATYNGERFIRTQLSSVIDQIGKYDEVIVSDDGSTDSTISIIESFEDPRIKIFRNGLESGPVKNFENAICQATNDIIFLCDQDDIWFADKIQKHLEHHKEYDLVISNAIVINEQKGVLFDSFFKQRGSRKGLFPNLLRNSYIGCCMSFNRKIAEASLPFPSGIHMHDWWIGLVAEVKGKSHFLDETLMYYVRHDSNASNTLIKKLPFIEQLKNRVLIMSKLFPVLFKRHSKEFYNN